MNSLHSPDSNGKLLSYTPRSVSDHALKTASYSDHDLNGKSPSYQILNKNSEHVQHVQRQRIPSYVAISCAISGYSNYNPYRRDGNAAVNHVVCEHTPQSSQSQSSQSSPVINSFKSSHSFSINNNSNHNIQQTDDFSENEIIANNNSLLHQKICSLYGETFAANWRESRFKCKLKENKIQTSPTFPSKSRLYNNNDKISNKNDIRYHTKSPPVFRRIEKMFLKHLESGNKVSKDISVGFSPTKPENEQSSGTTSLNSNSIAHNSNSSPKDGNWFLNELNNTTVEIQEKIAFTNNILEQQNVIMGEEMAGKLRAAIGKANLLINKKFNQFQELCFKNIKQSDSEEFVTTSEDLAGFWDMVLIQVIDIKQTFEEIKNLCENGWKVDAIDELTYSTAKLQSKAKNGTPKGTPKRTPKSTPKGTPKASPNKSVSNECSPKSRDAERRNRLKEAKRRQANMAKTDDEIIIFTPLSKE